MFEEKSKTCQYREVISGTSHYVCGHTMEIVNGDLCLMPCKEEKCPLKNHSKLSKAEN